MGAMDLNGAGDGGAGQTQLPGVLIPGRLPAGLGAQKGCDDKGAIGEDGALKGHRSNLPHRGPGGKPALGHNTARALDSAPLHLYVPPMRVPSTTWLALSLAAACTGGDSGAPQDTATGIQYRLQLQPVMPQDQRDLFADVATLVLHVAPAEGEPYDISLDAIDGGFGAEALDEITDATITLEGLDAGGAVVAWGQTPPLSALDGDEDLVTVLMARPESMARLSDLSVPTVGGVLVWAGDGRLLLFGGGNQGADGNRSGSDAVWALSTGTRSSGTSFEWVGALPPIDGVGDVTGRVGLSATRLTGATPDEGKIFIVGGGADVGGTDVVAHDAVLWDPQTDTAESVEGLDIRSGLFLHKAVEMPGGEGVALIGGFPETDSERLYLFGSTAWYYDAAARDLSTVRLSGAQSAYTLAAGAALMSEGVLVCGGVDLVDDAHYLISPGCDIIEPGGELRALEGGGDQLVEPVFHHEMTRLPSGEVLLTGGLSAADPTLVGTSDSLDATSGAWIYDGDSWRETLNPMNLPRAMHSSVLLADGRVLIFGGVSRNRSVFWSGTSAMPCAEIFTPGAETFTLLPEGCSAQSPTGALPQPAAWPTAAVDPLRGAVVLGGIDDNGDSIASVSMYFAPLPLRD